MELSYTQIKTPFKYPFTISGGRTKTHQSALVVSLRLANFIGYGEAPAISYYNVTVEDMISELEAKRKMVEQFALVDPERYWHYLHHLFPQNPFLVCALDMAAWDLFAKMNGQPLFKMFGFQWQNIPTTDYTIGIDSIEKMIGKIKDNPYPIYKIKLGTKDDVDIIKALKNETESTLRVDVNAGWELEEALEKIPHLEALGVELIEQPLVKNDWEGMKILYENSSLPLIADESCVTEHDVQICVGHFHGINIKLTKCGGLTPALRMIKNAKALGMKVMAGSMNETSIGSAAVANLLPALDFVDMDGPLLLADDYAQGITFDNAVPALKNISGLGIEVNIEKLKLQ